jgi:DNA-binding IclR family transcriptional regulator
MNGSGSPSVNKANLVPAVEKAVLIIQHLESYREPLTLTRISSDVGLPRSSTFRILCTLEQYGYVVRDGGGQGYSLGTRFIPLAQKVMAQMDLPIVANPYMERLTRETSQTSKLSVLYGGGVMTIHRVQSPHEISIAPQIGKTFPIHAGAASKLLLAYAPEELAKEVLEQPLQAYTPSTIVDPLLLAEELRKIRRNGYAVDNEEHAVGVRALACPVFGAYGQVIAALSIPFIATDMNTGYEERWLRALQETAAKISAAMGYSKPDNGA